MTFLKSVKAATVSQLNIYTIDLFMQKPRHPQVVQAHYQVIVT